MDFWRSIVGFLDVELTSAEPEAAMAAINGAGIEIKNLQKINELTYSFRIRRQNHRKLCAICEKRGESLRICKKRGLYWRFKSLLARPVLFGGSIFLLAMVLYLPTRVFFVKVEGNQTVPAKKILEAAENCGIGFGVSRREVRSEQVKNALLSAVPELQWAGVNTSGCVATISVRERSDSEEAQLRPEVASIVASRDGYVLSCTVTRGNALVATGQPVKEGQVLISGYTDCGICIRAECAEGEIMAQTNRSLEAVTPGECALKVLTGQVKRKYSLLFRKKRIFLWKDSGIWDASCGRMYEEYYITLPGGFQLPIALCVEEYICYESTAWDIPEAEAENALKTFAENYLTKQMIAGKILSSVQSVSSEEGLYRLTGEYACAEMIGKVRQEQIGDIHGKNN